MGTAWRLPIQWVVATIQVLDVFHLCMCYNVYWCLMCITSRFYMLDGYVCQSVSIQRIVNVMCVTVYMHAILWCVLLCIHTCRAVMCVTVYTGQWCVILCIQLHMSSTVQRHCECTCWTVVCVTLHTYMQHCDMSHCTYVSLYTCIMDLDVSLCVSTVLASGVHHFVRLFLQALACVTFVPKYPGVCQLTFLRTLVCVTFVPTNPGVCQLTFLHTLVCVTLCLQDWIWCVLHFVSPYIYTGLWCMSLCAHQHAWF